MTASNSKTRPIVRQRLGRTWQNPAWRKLRLGAENVTERAHASLRRLRDPCTDATALEGHSLALARSPVPLPDDGRPPVPSISIPQTVRGFA